MILFVAIKSFVQFKNPSQMQKTGSYAIGKSTQKKLKCASSPQDNLTALILLVQAALMLPDIRE
jgi:hypothetical protein